MTDSLGSLDLSRSLQTESIIYFVISPRLILQMRAGLSDVTFIG